MLGLPRFEGLVMIAVLTAIAVSVGLRLFNAL